MVDTIGYFFLGGIALFAWSMIIAVIAHGNGWHKCMERYGIKERKRKK